MANLKDLTEEMSTKCPDCGKKVDLVAFVKGLFTRMSDKLYAGEDIRIMGFGKFYTSTLKGRVMKMKDKEFAVPDKRVVRFKASSKLKDFLNK